MRRLRTLLAATALLGSPGCSYRAPHASGALARAEGEARPGVYHYPLHVFAAWVRGKLPESMDYGPDSKMTQRMMKSVGVRRVRDAVREWLSSLRSRDLRPGDTASSSFGPAVRRWTLLDIPFHWNWTEQVVGSYTTRAQATATVMECDNEDHEDCQAIKARALFLVVNVMGRRSFFRILLRVQDKHTPGPMRNFTMNFSWTEDVSVDCCPPGAR